VNRSKGYRSHHEEHEGYEGFAWFTVETLTTQWEEYPRKKLCVLCVSVAKTLFPLLLQREEREGAHLDALPRLRIRRRGGIVE
jgi:hypothetical protein